MDAIRAKLEWLENVYEVHVPPEMDWGQLQSRTATIDINAASATSDAKSGAKLVPLWPSLVGKKAATANSAMRNGSSSSSSLLSSSLGASTGEAPVHIVAVVFKDYSFSGSPRPLYLSLVHGLEQHTPLVSSSSAATATSTGRGSSKKSAAAAADSDDLFDDAADDNNDDDDVTDVWSAINGKDVIGMNMREEPRACTRVLFKLQTKSQFFVLKNMMPGVTKKDIEVMSWASRDDSENRVWDVTYELDANTQRPLCPIGRLLQIYDEMTKQNDPQGSGLGLKRIKFMFRGQERKGYTVNEKYGRKIQRSLLRSLEDPRPLTSLGKLALQAECAAPPNSEWGFWARLEVFYVPQPKYGDRPSVRPSSSMAAPRAVVAARTSAPIAAARLPVSNGGRAGAANHRVANGGGRHANHGRRGQAVAEEEEQEEDDEDDEDEDAQVDDEEEDQNQ